MSNIKLDICITMDKEYILGAIDTINGVFTTAEDAACFDTAMAKLTKDVARTGGVEILSFGEITAVILPHYGIAEAMEIDINMEEFVQSSKGFIKASICKAFADVGSEVTSEPLMLAITSLDEEIYRKSAYWQANHEPEYPMQATRDRGVTVDDGFELKKDYIISIVPELSLVTKPEMSVMVNVPNVSDLVRAFKDTLTDEDYIYPEILSGTTSEFNTEEDTDEIYRISASQLYTDMSVTIKFNYFAEILAPSKDLVQLTEMAMQSVYYKQNLRTIKANLGIDNENLEYLVGHSEVSETLNPNETLLYKVLENLLVSCLMYEYDFFSIASLEQQGEIRSYLFDNFMLGYIRRLLKDNFSYTGKAYLGHDEMDDEEESEASLDLYGYDRIQMINGSYTLVKLSQEDLVKRNEPFELDGDQNVLEYLNDITSSRAYVYMFLFMLRFGATKNRYIKVPSKSEPKYPYFDTLTFKSIAVPTIDASFVVQKTASGKSFIITGDVRLDKVFDEYNAKLSLPIGVVLTQMLSNGATTKEKHIVLDISSFCSTVAKLKEDKTPYYDVEGIDFGAEGKVTMDKTTIGRTIANHYNAIQVCQLLQEESDKRTFIVETIPVYRRQINAACADAGVPSTSYTFFDAYKLVEEGEFGYKETLTKPVLSNFSAPSTYVAVRVASLLLPSAITQSLGNSFEEVGVIDAIESAIALSATKVVDNTNKFNEFLQETILKYCKIVSTSGDEIGYAFVINKAGKDYMLVTSRQEIGLRMPTVKSWRILPFSPKFEAICGQLNSASDKEAFREALIEKRYVFDTVETFKILQEANK